MKFLRHPEYNIILERVLKAVEILNSSDQDKIDEFKENVKSIWNTLDFEPGAGPMAYIPSKITINGENYV